MNDTSAPSVLSRRRLLHLAAGSGAAAALAACAGPGAGTTTTAAAPSASGSVKGDLSFAHWRAEDKATFDTIIKGFVAAHPGVQVRQDISTSSDYQTTGLQKVQGAAIGDVFTAFRGAQFTNMHKAGLYADLSGQDVVQRYTANLITAGQVAGKQWGLPYQVVFNMPVYNIDLFDKAGVSAPPKDWDSFLSACDALKRRGVVPIAWPGGDTGNSGQLLNSMVMNNAPAADMFAQLEKGTLKVTDDWFLTTLKQYQQLTPYMQPNPTGTAVEPAQQMFASGKAAMLATGSFHIAPVRALGATFPVDVLAPITVAADEARYQGIFNATFILGVNTASKKQPAALAFVEYLSDPKTAGEYANASVQHVSVAGVDYTNPDLKRLAHWLTAKTLLAPRYQFSNLNIQAAVDQSTVKVVGGASPDQVAEQTQAVIDQQRA